MKKIISILSITLLFTSLAHAKEGENSWAEMNLKGKVKSMQESKYAVAEKSGEVQKGERKDSIIYIFNENGYKIEKNRYMPDGSIKAGLGEPAMKKLKVGKIIQLYRIGFCRVDKIGSEIALYFAHK